MNDADRKLLEFEGQPHGSVAQKDAAIRETFNLSAAKYYQRVNRILDDPASLAAEPMLVKRLLRLRARRLGDRANRVLGGSATRTATLKRS